MKALLVCLFLVVFAGPSAASSAMESDAALLRSQLHALRLELADQEERLRELNETVSRRPSTFIFGFETDANWEGLFDGTLQLLAALLIYYSGIKRGAASGRQAVKQNQIAKLRLEYEEWKNYKEKDEDNRRYIRGVMTIVENDLLIRMRSFHEEFQKINEMSPLTTRNSRLFEDQVYGFLGSFSEAFGSIIELCRKFDIVDEYALARHVKMEFDKKRFVQRKEKIYDHHGRKKIMTAMTDLECLIIDMCADVESSINIINANINSAENYMESIKSDITKEEGEQEENWMPLGFRMALMRARVERRFRKSTRRR